MGADRVEWDELLAQADYISLHVHHTEDTRGLLDATAFAAMDKQPFIINASRAELIDKAALIDALAQGTIKGLGIDAHYDEPTSATDELWTFPTVFASPHDAGSTIDSNRDTVDKCVQNLERAMSGAVPEGLIR